MPKSRRRSVAARVRALAMPRRKRRALGRKLARARWADRNLSTPPEGAAT